MRPGLSRILTAAPLLGLAAPASGQLITQTGADYAVHASASGEYDGSDASQALGTVVLSVGKSISFAYDCGAEIQVINDILNGYVSANIYGLGISRSYAPYTCDFGVDMAYSFHVNQPITLTIGTNHNGWNHNIYASPPTFSDLTMDLLDENGVPIIELESPLNVYTVDNVTLNLPVGDYVWTATALGQVLPEGSAQSSAGATGYLQMRFTPLVACSPADVNTTNTNPGDASFGLPDGQVDGADLSYFVEQWLAGNAAVADLNTTNTNPGDPGYGQPDGSVNGADLSYFVENWLAGCP